MRTGIEKHRSRMRNSEFGVWNSDFRLSISVCTPPPSFCAPHAALRTRDFFLAGLVAVGLTLVFWWPLWRGGGFIGGDVYTYYLPQKMFYAERLQDGEFPLWNNRTGHGYPLIAESQTGAFYPSHLLLYRTLDVNTAYNVNHLLHYVLAFVFTWMYTRSIGFTSAAGLFSALVYTYGWFPPRSCLEWAIIGGAYFPLALWCVESFLQTRRWRYLILLSVSLGLQMLAGHYNLAFITQLVLTAYVPLRFWFAGAELSSQTKRLRARCISAVAISIFLGFAVSAVQLLPTWELKQHSQRASVGADHDPGYGHIPPLYWSQVIAPWLWYSRDIDIDKALANMRFLSSSSATNKVEAHLYFGLIPTGLMLLALTARRFGLAGMNRRLWLWTILAVAALIYTPGWLLGLTKHLPGFNFFIGPGRYGIVTTLAVALLAGFAFGELFKRSAGLKRALLTAVVFGFTTGDLWLVSRLVKYVDMLDNPPIASQQDSEVRRRLLAADSPARMFAPGPNLPTLTGIACTPPYLGIGPAAYYDPALKMPESPANSDSKSPESQRFRGLEATPEQVAWLQRAGVTHVLSFQELDRDDWPVTLVWQGHDALLNPAWGRYRLGESIFLYRLQATRGRAAFARPKPGDTVKITEYRANRVGIETNSASAGRLILTDLMYPGWKVTVDGQPAKAILFEGMYRAVDLPPKQHTVVWTYRPASVYWGAIVSAVALLLLAAIAHVRYWHPDWLVVLNPDYS